MPMTMHARSSQPDEALPLHLGVARIPEPILPAPDPLLVCLRAGDNAAWSRVVAECQKRMQGVALRILGNEDEARDAVQAAFAQATVAIRRFRGGSQLSTWLHRITVNEALMRIRKRSRHPEARIDDLLPQFSELGAHQSAVAIWPDPDEVLMQEQMADRVRECIARLPKRHRIALMLRDIEGLDTEQVAKILHLTPNAVRIRVHRARMALRALLEPYVLEAGTRHPAKGSSLGKAPSSPVAKGSSLGKAPTTAAANPRRQASAHTSPMR